MNIITFDLFKEKFERAIIDVKNKDSFIDNEIREIENYLFSDESYLDPRKLYVIHARKKRRVFDFEIQRGNIDLFSEAFQGFDIDGEFIDEHYNDELTLNIIEQAKQFCLYYQWLKQLKLGTKPTTKKTSLSHKQKMLALHYLGLDLSLGDNTKLAFILSEILELNEDNTRQYLSYLISGKNEVRTKNNLTKVNQLFKNQGFIDLSITIELDLEKL
jgi:hypothetical protein